MPWLKLLHITAVILWCGALFYMAAAIHAAASSQASSPRVLRMLFTLVAGPAALAAIVSGTAIFVLLVLHPPWLMAKLALVGLLVLGHAGCGLLILRVERGEPRRVRGASIAVLATTLLWVAAIAWLVLWKPA